MALVLDNGTVETLPDESIDFSSIKTFQLSHCLEKNDERVRSILSQCVNLEEIELVNSTKVTDATLLAIANNCKKLKVANFSRLLNITNDSIVSIAENCADLVSLNIVQTFHLKGPSAIMSIVNNCKHITELTLGNSDTITDEVLMAIATAYGPQLQKLILWSNFQIHKNESMAFLLERCNNLTMLNLSGCRGQILNHLTINNIALYCKNIRFLDISKTPCLNDECIENLVQNCSEITDLNISSNRLSLLSMHNIVRYLLKLRTICFSRYNEMHDYSGNDLHDPAFAILDFHFQYYTLIDLVDCKVGGFPRDRSDDSINALDEAINFHRKRIKAANEPAFKEGDGCYGEDEDYQAGNITSGTIEKMATKCTGTLTEFHINDYCTVVDLMVIIQWGGESLRKLLICLNKLSDAEMLIISEKCRDLTYLSFSCCLSSTAVTDQGLTNLFAANPNLVDVSFTGQCWGRVVSSLSEAAIRNLANNCPLLQRVDISANKFVTNECLVHLAQKCPQLLELNVARCSEVGDSGLGAIIDNCKALREINANLETKVTSQFACDVVSKYWLNSQYTPLLNAKNAFSW